jgi:hypothetical protein
VRDAAHSSRAAWRQDASMTRYALCLFLLCSSAMVSARDVRMHGANGDGGACAEPASPAGAIATTAKPATTTAASHAKIKAPTLFRGGDDDATPHMPRWHSFLPGMFR